MAGEKNEKHTSEKLRFLLVDNDHQSVMSISSMLETLGSNVDAANCGMAAINCLNNIWYDAVIMDTELTDINGNELIRQIKAKSVEIRTIVMAKQACLEPELIETKTADSCIEKPFSMSDLKTVLSCSGL